MERERERKREGRESERSDKVYNMRINLTTITYPTRVTYGSDDITILGVNLSQSSQLLTPFK
jgi:hypothetical protein